MERLFGAIKNLLSGSNEAEVKRIMKTVKLIEDKDAEMQKLTDAELRGLTAAFRNRLEAGEELDALIVDALAAVREGAYRAIGQKAFPVQLVGAIVLHQGRIAEMKTGEGKTLTAALAAYLNALPGKGVHVVTVNDYLAKYHSEWMGKIYRFMGLKVGLILHDMQPEDRQEAYNADVTYATNNELGFDYLRDNMVVVKERMVQRPLNFAIVDEVDSILIDEARTPLIISGQGDKSTELYQMADRFVSRLREGEDKDFIKDEKDKTISLTEEGVRKAEQAFNVENLADVQNNELYHHILAALRANALMKRDVDYVVKDGQVIIVDEFTGRLMTGRRYSDGLHQAIEAKEHVKVERESKTLATITFQNYFRMYKKISGMTGTAKTEEEEFRGIYKLDVVQIPTNRPMIRKDENDAVYTTEKGKFEAVADEVEKLHATGQPVLVGTVSVEKSEYVSKLLEKRGIRHTVLNAKFHEKEAEIVAQAGKKGAVTISTNMAGRGTDILLGGNAEFMAKSELRRQGYDEALIEEAVGHAEDVSQEILDARKLYNELYAKYKVDTDREHEEVVKLGGLYIIGTERHESRRIDNQLRGRAGRQGDPGASRFFISLQDDLMRLFGSERVQPIINRLGVSENDRIEYGILSKQIEASQKRVESRNYDIRRNVLQYDDVMNTQRNIIYAERREVLEGGDMRKRINDMRDTIIEEAVNSHVSADALPEDWNIKGLAEYLERVCVAKGDVQAAYDALTERTKDKLLEAIKEKSEKLYASREKMITDAGFDMREVERTILLNSVDRRWMDHIDAMDLLREGIGLRAYGQRQPIVEYQHEGYDMFEEMVHLIQEDTLRRLCTAIINRPPERKEVAKNISVNTDTSVAKMPVKAVKKVGRNDPCPCGSGKKYKECHGRNA
ncbi:MAG: preprotein translocase subunit SecA [Clostridia bacterium]|nr:preprotein translocase subunit SecA [Clostridia bacterium]